MIVPVYPRLFLRSGYSTPLAVGAKLSTRRYSWSTLGGPDRASVEVFGTADNVWEALNWLRCPIELVDGDR
jgi:hypothetical protein